MAKIKVRYFKWRGGRPRWEPGPGLRLRGFKGQNLKSETGDWLDMGAAIVAAERLNAIAKEDKPKQAGKLNLAGRLFSQVCQSYMQTPEFKDKKPRTKQGYRNNINRIKQVFGDVPVNQLKRHHVKKYWRTLKENNGHATANSIITVFRIVLYHAVDMEWIAINPAAKQNIASVPIQVIYHNPDECSAMVDMADSMGEFGIGDAIILAIHTGQRQGDILKMQPSLLKNGKVQIRQAQDKTGSLVDFPATSLLQSRIKQAMLRNGVRTDQMGQVPLVIDDHTGKPFNASTFQHRYKAVKQACMARHRLNELSQKQFKHYRPTALTRLYMAGCTQLQIAAISGHSLDTVNKILKHYVALNAGDGSKSIEAYETWLKQENIAI